MAGLLPPSTGMQTAPAPMLGSAVPALTAPPFTASAPPVSGSLGGIVSIKNAAAVVADQRAQDAAFQAQQAQPLIQGLAGYIRNAWTQAKQAKQTIETEMLEALRCRSGMYSDSKLAEIKQSSQPAIYMMLGASKMRQVEALLRDVIIGSGTEKPWTLRPTPDPEIPPYLVSQIVQGIQQEIAQAMASGIQPTMNDVRIRMRDVKDQIQAAVRDEAAVRCARMEIKMEDQLIEGDYLDALDSFITDLATFKTAFVKGPIVKNVQKLSYDQTGAIIVEPTLQLTWKRVDPFMMYPAAWASDIDKGPLIERHQLTREALTEMKGVDGFDSKAIDQVLALYGTTGLTDWLWIDTARANAENKDQIGATTRPELIDALQFWGTASGKMLVDWGMPRVQAPDPSKEYHVECWMVGTYVIKAVLNADPLARRPYYADSFQRIPGAVWGNAPYDLMRDCQDMCNGAARSLAANLAISSGPQVGVLTDRMPSGEDITEQFPWKIWQFNSDPMGSMQKPIEFFQPKSNAAELMQVYAKFSDLADEYTGIPRYMAGLESGGMGRTASGLSMMIGNASKVIKQVVMTIDKYVIDPMLDRLYYYNMKYSDDPDLKGDVKVVARGAMSLTTKDTVQQRRSEFLAMTANPIDMQIIGLDGRGEVLRTMAAGLNMDTDKIVPPISELKQRQAVAAAQQQAQIQQQMALNAAGIQGAEPPGQGTPAKPPSLQNNQRLINGAPVADNFSPTPQG